VLGEFLFMGGLVVLKLIVVVALVVVLHDFVAVPPAKCSSSARRTMHMSRSPSLFIAAWTVERSAFALSGTYLVPTCSTMRL
jgi:hypothetical protein